MEINIDEAMAAAGAPAAAGTNGTAAAAPTETFKVHVTRPGGPTGLDRKGQPAESSIDTIATLAKEYGVPWQAIAEATFDTIDPVKIAEMLRDEGFGVSVSGHWLMSPGLQVKIPLVGKDGKALTAKKTGIPGWVKVLGLGALGAVGVWAISALTGGGGKKRDRDEDPDDRDDDGDDDD